jgi:hypothetical protein
MSTEQAKIEKTIDGIIPAVVDQECVTGSKVASFIELSLP